MWKIRRCGNFPANVVPCVGPVPGKQQLQQQQQKYWYPVAKPRPYLSLKYSFLVVLRRLGNFLFQTEEGLGFSQTQWKSFFLLRRSCAWQGLNKDD